MFALASAAAGAFLPEVGRGLSTGLAAFAANRGQGAQCAACPSCSCAPQLHCPELRCDCSGLQGASVEGPSLAAVALACAFSGCAGALLAAAACWRLAGGRIVVAPHHVREPDVEPDFEEEARAQGRQARARALQL